MEESSIVNDKIGEPNAICDRMEESSSVSQKLKDLDDFNDTIETSNTVNGESSEVEDLDISESEEIFPAATIPLNIDCNARIVTKEVMCDNEGDDCDMQFVEKNNVYLLEHRGSEVGLHTSTEDLNVSDDEQSCASALQSVNLDGLASTSKRGGINSLSTSNISHTVFKDEFSFEAEYLSDEEIRCALKEKSDGKDKLCQLNPELKLEGLLLTFRPPPSFFSPITPDASNTFNASNLTPISAVDESQKHDLNVDQNSPSKTYDLSKSEYSDGHNTDAEDISFGSVDDIIELSKNRNPFGKGYNAFSLPETHSEFPSGNSNDERQVYPGDSRRSSAVEFLTDDETLTLENFSVHEMKRIKKFDFRVIDKNEKFEDSLTDEEDIEDQ